MNLSDLNRKASRYAASKRRGRGHGSGLGKTGGRGHKGAHSRSGFKHRPGFEGGQMPLYRRIPKRGFTNSQFKTLYDIVNVEDLNRFADGETIDHEALVARGLLKNRHGALKVLGDGKLERRNLVVTAARFSASARRQIEELGGEAKQGG